MSLNHQFRHGRKPWLLLALAALPGYSLAATCDFTSPDGDTLVDFGVYTPGQTNPQDPLPVQLGVQCTPDDVLDILPANVEVGIDGGASGDVFDRRFFGAGGELQYNLYADITRTQVIGNGEPGSVRLLVSCPLLQICLSPLIYGRIPGGQLIGGGSYSDMVTVTVEF